VTGVAFVGKNGTDVTVELDILCGDNCALADEEEEELCNLSARHKNPVDSSLSPPAPPKGALFPWPRNQPDSAASGEPFAGDDPSAIRRTGPSEA
jgi:hypothetical protein